MNWTTASRGTAAVAALALAVVGVVGSTANQGCIYDSSLLGAEGAEGGTTPPTPECPIEYNAGQSAALPARPVADDPSTLDLTVVVAMQSIDVGVGVGPDGGLTTVDGGLVSPNAPQPHIGYDLDGVCTCCGAPPSCTQFPSSKENCDDDAGRDNTGIKLFRDLGPSAQAGNQLVNQSMYNGEYGIILEITGYNGQPNDRQVTVNVFASNGMVLDGGAGPHHDGTDKWTVDPRYLNNGTFLVGMDCENNPSCVPVYSDSDAYVSCGVLVAKTFTTQPVPFTFGGRAAFGGAQMALQDPYVVGNLVQTTVFGGNVGWSITNGSVSGRWESQAALSNMASIPDPTVDSGAFLCGTDQLYPTVKSIVCGLQDIRSTPTSDNMGLPCDSLSVAFGFTASQVQLGQVASIPLTPAGCFGEGGAEAGAPFMDSCE